MKSSVLLGDDDEEGGDKSGQGAVREEAGGAQAGKPLTDGKLQAVCEPRVVGRVHLDAAEAEGGRRERSWLQLPGGEVVQLTCNM